MLHARTELSFVCLAGLFKTQEASYGSNALTPEQIDAAVIYVQKACETRNNAKKVSTGMRMGAR
jgi:hypothetical protein